MAFEAPVQLIPGALAGSSFVTGNGYGSTGQYLIVKSSATNKTYVPCTAVGDRPSGISQDTPASGGALGVMRAGISKVLIGTGGLTAGDEYGTDTQGKAVRKASSGTGANYGNYVLGEVIEGGAAGELATVTVDSPYRTN